MGQEQALTEAKHQERLADCYNYLSAHVAYAGRQSGSRLSFDEIVKRVADGPIRFKILVQLAKDGDQTVPERWHKGDRTGADFLLFSLFQ